MAVGLICSHETFICGHLTLMLTDAEGNIKTVRMKSNIISSKGQRKMIDALFQGSTGIRAIYAYIWSGMNGTPTISMTLALSGYGNPSINLTNIPCTLCYSFQNEANWSLNGTMSFRGYGGFSSIDAAALAYNLQATTSAASLSISDWYAAACFTDLAVQSADLMTFNWVFSMSCTLSGGT